MTTDKDTRIALDLSLDEFRILHAALMARPYGEVERLIGKLRQAAAAAVQAASGATRQKADQS